MAFHWWLLVCIASVLNWNIADGNLANCPRADPAASDNSSGFAVEGRINDTDSTVKRLYVAGLFGFGGAWASGAAFLPAVEMGLEHVNAREDILPGYNLTMVWGDTQCSPGIGVDKMYSFLYRGPPKLMILGGGCSTVTEATAEASHLWGIVQLSYVSSSPSLSDKKRFPRFFRVAAPDVLANPTRIQMFQQFGWTKVATIHQSVELFSEVTQDLVQRLKAANITLITSEIFTDNPELHIRNLKKHDARIIVGGFYLDVLGTVFCEAYRAGLYGPKYVWILVGWYDEGWWQKPELAENCSPEQITEAAEGHFGTGFVYINPIQERGLSGLTSREWKEAYDKRIGYADVIGVQEASQGYDAAWVAAIALNMTLTELRKAGRGRALEDFQYGDQEVTDMLLHNMRRVNFLGVKGPVSFDKNGDNPGVIKVRRLQGGRREVLGYHSVGGPIQWLKDPPIKWHNGIPPKDSIRRKRKSLFVPVPLYITMNVLATIGFGLSVLFLSFNTIHRKHRVIKMSSPSLNNLIIVGCMLGYATIFLQDLESKWTGFHCKARSIAMSIGFSLSFGSLFAKTWRVYKIFTNRTRRVILRDRQLFGMVIVLVLIDVLVVIVREVGDPQTVITESIKGEEVSEGDMVVQTMVHRCVSTYSMYHLILQYVIKGSLLVFGAFLAVQTREVHIQGLNDSQFVGLCIYNVAVLSVLGVVLSVALTDKVALLYGCFSGLLLMGTTATLLIIFVPKIMKLRATENMIQDIIIKDIASTDKVYTISKHGISARHHREVRHIGVTTEDVQEL